MGLDMYLFRTGRVKGFAAEDYMRVNHYVHETLATQRQLSANGGSLLLAVDPLTLDLEAATGLGGANALRTRIRQAGDMIHQWYSIFENVAYWRKVNAVHAWFVQTVQGGVDECQVGSSLTRDQLMELRDRAKLVLAARPEAHRPISRIAYRLAERTAVTLAALIQDPQSPFGERQDAAMAFSQLQAHNVAELLLPPCGGFFFGDTTIDSYYYEDLSDTITQIDAVLESTDFDTHVVFYQSSLSRPI